MNAADNRIPALVRDIRLRWRRRALWQGAALSLLTLAFFGSALLLLYTAFAVPLPYLTAGAGVGALVLLGVVAWYVVRPGLRRISDRQIALFVEEKIPELEDRLNSAVEIGDVDRVREAHGAIVDRLLDDAAFRARAIPIATIVDRKKERILTYASAAFALLFAVFAYTTVDDLRLAVSQADLGGLLPRPLLTVRPGDAEIEKGASQEVVVELRDDSDRPVTLHFKMGEGAWQKATMQRGVGEPAFLYEFFDVQEPVTYFAEHNGHRAGPFTLSLYEFPDVARIDVTYRYPAYTGLPPRTEEDTGDIRGLKGSTVTLTVEATGTTREAELVLDDDTVVPMKPADDGRFRASLPLEREGYYSVRLTDARGKHNKFPDAYRIVPVEDAKPYVTVTDPQRDVRANAVQEVLVAARVEDDFGVKDVRLRYSVNGGEERAVSLMDSAAARPTEVAGEHLFFLEEYDLQPGDVISYYVEAEDHFHPGTEATDMYFIEVVPFDQRFSQANNMGGMAGAQPSGIVLSQQQIIAATWKLIRERDAMDAAAFDEARRGLVQAQANLKANIEQRINATAFSLELQADEDTRRIAGYLREAVGEMNAALRELEPGRLQQALTPERRALTHLLRADALNKERQIAMSRQSSPGGMSATEERMTELMDLELDISKDKYEVQQQRPPAQQEQQVDEALEKIRELARRQENLTSQSRQQLQGEDRRRHVERLQRDQDALRRQTESLAQRLRQSARSNEQMDGGRMQEQLDRVSEQMREAERALREGDPQRAAARQQQALNELNRLQQDLRFASNDNTRSRLDDLARRFDQLRRQEQQLEQDLRRAAEQARRNNGRPDAAALDRLREQREAVRESLQRLEEDAEALHERLRREDAALSAAARDVAQRIRREELDEQMRDSREALARGWLDRAERLEEDIAGSMERLGNEMNALSGRLPESDEERLTRALDDVRDLARRLREMQAQSGQPRQSQSGQPQDGQAGSNPGRADAARMQRQLERAQEQLDRLQEQLGGMPGTQALARQVRSALARADHTGTRLEGDAAKAFFEQRIFAPLSQLEQELARRLDRTAIDKKLYGSRPTDVPAEYRDLVERYYESLSKGRER